MALLDCAINEKCLGEMVGHLPSFFVLNRGNLTAQESSPWKFAIQGRKNANIKRPALKRWLGPAGIH